MWPPLNASGEGSPHTANGVSNPMQQFQGTCAFTHMYQWNHTCPTNGTSGTFSPHSKWTYYLAVPTTPPPTTCPSLNEGTCTKNNLTGPPHTGASPCPSPTPPPPLFSLPVLYCKLRQQTRGQWGQELPLTFTAITHYVSLEPATNNPSEINTAKLTPTLPAREHQLPHNQRINVAPT